MLTKKYGPPKPEFTVFVANRNQTPIGMSAMYRIFSDLWHTMGGRSYSRSGEGLHALRVSAARRMYARGVSVDYLLQRLSISSEVLLERFLHLDDTIVKAREEALEQRMLYG